jgi:hypothetical protein
MATSGVPAWGADVNDAPQTAEELLRAGVELRKEHKDREALAAFERANALSPSPVARAQMALARAAAADWVAAEEDMRAALEAPEHPWIVRNRAQLDAMSETIAQHLGWLEVDVDVAGAETMLDGRVLSGRRTRVAAGRAVLQTRASGYLPDLRGVEVPVAGVAHVAVSLRAFPLLSMPSPSPAQAPVAAPSVAPRSVAMPLPLPEAPHRQSRVAPLAVGAAGLLALGVGTYFGVRAFIDKGQRDANCDGLACKQAGLDADADGRLDASVSTATVAVGGAAVVASLAWLLLTRTKSAPSTPRPTLARNVHPVFEITFE